MDDMMFAVGAAAPVGQAVLTATGATTWTVPLGVTSISAVAVQAGGSTTGATIQRGATVLLRALNGSRVGDGGGNGGACPYPGGVHGTTGNYYQPGGQGAGGYSGNGGDAGGYESVTFYTRLPTAGAGGGGGGGQGQVQFMDPATAGSTSVGGGVGLLGEGASGGTGVNGLPGSGGSGATYGGGYWNSSNKRGGALAWKNAIPVTPGEVLNINIPAPSAGSGPGAIRIMWGGERSYPYNAGDIT